MEYAQYRPGRVFVVRFDEGDEVVKLLEDFAREHKIRAASLTLLGALQKPKIVIGSRKLRGLNKPHWANISSEEGFEVVGFGTIFLLTDEKGSKKLLKPSAHIHIAAGRKNVKSIVGCLRGVKDVYITIECVIQELLPYRTGNNQTSMTRRRLRSGVALLSKQ